MQQRNNNNQNRGGGMMQRHNHKNRHNRNNNQNRGGGGGQQGQRINISQVTNQRDKFLNHARDAQHSGDRVLMEYYLQHADHYQRLINDYNEEQEARRAQFAPSPSSSSENVAAEEHKLEDTATAEDAPSQSRPQREPREGRARQDRRPRSPRPQPQEASAEEAESENFSVAAILPPPILRDAPAQDSDVGEE